MNKLKDFNEIKDKWLADPKVKKEYDSLDEEFNKAAEVIKAKIKPSYLKTASKEK